jgi:hypothetical protein
VSSPSPELLHSYYYAAPVHKFLSEHPTQILGTLAQIQPYDLKIDQREAWEQEIRVLKNSLKALQGTIFLEFDVPRLGRRIDAVLVSGPAIFTMEFKCGADRYQAADRNQAWDYALDLKNFHSASRDAPILPVLIATDATFSDAGWGGADSDRVLLTRARQGMVIFVPKGKASDPTRAAEFYDQTYAYLSGIGIGNAICPLKEP